MTNLPPNVTDEMLSAEFWVSSSEQGVDLSQFRHQHQTYIFDHTDSTNPMTALWEQTRNERYPFPTPQFPPSERPVLYDATGAAFDAAFWDEIAAQITSARPTTPSTQAGFSVTRANLRRYPTLTAGFRDATDIEFDRFQDTALHTFEPVLVLLETNDGQWNFVLSTTYAGWVQSHDIARATPSQFEYWANITQNPNQQFVIPLANSVYTHANPYTPVISRKNLEFAAYLPVCSDLEQLGNQSIAGNLAIYLPTRNHTGSLDVKPALVSKSEFVHVGFRPFTREAVVKSAFALLSERYGWGDSLDSHDCSSFIMDSYRTIGIQLPRDAGQQEEALPNFLPIPSTLSLAERTVLLTSLAPGDPVYMPGHTMMYLGYRDNHHYVIHDFSGYMEKTETGHKNVRVNEIMVSTLDMLTSRDRTYLEELTGAGRLFQ